MLAAGAGAFARLRQLQAIDQEVKNRLLNRTQALSVAVISVEMYNGRLMQVLAGQTPIGNEIALQARAAHNALQHYPPDCGEQQRKLLQDMAAELANEEDRSAILSSLVPEERPGSAALFIQNELLPRSLNILRAAQQLADLDREAAARENEEMLVRVETLRTKLKKMLSGLLAGGLLLSVVGSFYILRLERRARESYRRVAASRVELEALSARLVSVQEQERRSIARELHDEVGQTLQALLIDLGRLSRLMPPTQDAAREQIEHVTWLAKEAVKTVRNMSLLLRPSMLDDLGLMPALEWQAREISRRGDMEVEVSSATTAEELPDATKICVYRIVQEALNNAANHSSAKKAQVSLSELSDRLRIEITDDGSGFDAQRVRGIGLLGMEERVKHLGGTLTIVSRNGHGTSVIAELPLVGRDIGVMV